MDRLSQRLRDDAQRIDARISPELQRRIDASLRGVTPVPVTAKRPSRPPRFVWLAGGVAVAVVLVAVIQLMVAVTPSTTMPETPAVRVIDLDAEALELVNPLSEELQNLQADLRKAEKMLREDIGF